jgi:hypothetical protein
MSNLNNNTMKTFARKCDITNEGMNEGWVWGDGTFYTKHLKDTLNECRKDREHIIADICSLSAESVNDYSKWGETADAIDRVKANADTDEDLLFIGFQTDYLYFTEWDKDDHQYQKKNGLIIEID